MNGQCSDHGELRKGMSKKEKKQEVTEAADLQGELSEVESLTAQIAELTEQLASSEEACTAIKDQMLRDRADLENYRKRLIRDKEDSIRFANENLIKDLLQPLDDFARALEASESTKDYTKVHDGVVMVNAQIYSTLEKNWGLERIEAVGKEFDPQEHEAYQVVVDESLEHETVLEEYVVGYKLHGRVLRPSKVKVGKPNV
ncbi:MAG: nucleotide exchange factor GrpE [Spirochaetales bacterium]|jgi:molecular chaperone GrpE|nr:nucleotide exchange factor GrpE [Spirochaetales bacterium]